MTTREDYISAVEMLVPGDHPIGEAEITKAVQKALNTHSRHKPRIVTEDETGDGGFDYPVTDLDGWAEAFSVIKKVEYPVDDTDENADILEESEWQLYGTPAGEYLRFLAGTPETTESFRVTYTARHTCTDSACTVADADEEAVQALAASFFCRMLAVHYAQDQDATIPADSVDHGAKTEKYEKKAKDYRGEYNDHMNIKPGKTPAASVTVDQDTIPSWRTDGLTHRRKYR